MPRTTHAEPLHLADPAARCRTARSLIWTIWKLRSMDPSRAVLEATEVIRRPWARGALPRKTPSRAVRFLSGRVFAGGLPGSRPAGGCWAPGTGAGNLTSYLPREDCQRYGP